MYRRFYVLGTAAGCMALGLLYRCAAALPGTDIYLLLDQFWYPNHTYLIGLLLFASGFLSAARGSSLDALPNPEIRSHFTPRWTLWLLRVSTRPVVFFGGIAKINSDWLSSDPMRMWLAAHVDFPVIGWFFTDEWGMYFLS